MKLIKKGGKKRKEIKDSEILPYVYTFHFFTFWVQKKSNEDSRFNKSLSVCVYHIINKGYLLIFECEYLHRIIVIL